MKARAAEGVDDYDYFADLKQTNQVEVGERIENYQLRERDCIILHDKS